MSIVTIQVPAYREDMDSYPDVAEEVIRMYGYEHVIPTFMPDALVTTGGMNARQKKELKLKKDLCAQGAFEVPRAIVPMWDGGSIFLSGARVRNRVTSSIPKSIGGRNHE